MAEHWQLFTAVAALVAAWSLIMIATQRWVINKCVSGLDQKIQGLSIDLDKKIEALNNIPKDYQNLERSFMALKADLPLSYVRKEDFIRFDVVINTKLDRLRDLIEELRERKNGPRS